MPEGERGTPECKRYHAEYCNLTAMCTGQTHCECVDDASSITCISDADATRCADEIASGSCAGGLPEGCGLAEMADRGVAMAGCELYLTTVCEVQARCRGTDEAVCLEEARGRLDCPAALGLKPAFERCLAETQALECSATDLPASCEGVILLES
jgi:hypothetical protein